MEIRSMQDGDVDAVLALNAASVDATSPLDAPSLATYRSMVADDLVCLVDEQVAAFALAYGPGAAYPSINYRWHADRFDDFLYLDRIVVGADFRRRGIASALYDRLEEVATARGRMVCEVYSDPPNTGSLAFHRGRGYVEIGYLDQANGYQCVMLEKPL
jgi:uncharacterized protein